MEHKMRGDTLVEVLLAIMILATVIVGSITIMNRGLIAAQTALEHSQVRLAINSQLEMLRQIRDEYARDKTTANALTWKAVIDAAPDSGTLGYQAGCTSSQPTTDFYLSATATQISRNAYNDAPAPNTPLAGQGLWVEAKKSNGVSPAFLDIVLRACWKGIGSSTFERTVTAVRLYDPYR